MSHWSVHAAESVLLLAQSLPDTIVTKQVDPGLFAKVTGVASGLVSIALLVLTVALVPAAWNFRKSYAKVNKLLERIESDVAPIMRHASTIADNVDYISTSVRTDIRRVSQTIESANERLNRALALSERRVRELNALLRVVQEEAEDTFVSTAATVRGVRAGAAAFQEPVLNDLEDIELEAEEEDDGDDDTIADVGDRPSGADARPRIRRKPKPH